MIYMDNAATFWPKPPSVIQAMTDYMTNIGANSGRSGHRLAIEAGRIVYETREAVAELFNISDPLRVVFCSNATEALNLAMRGFLQAGDGVITSSIEHNSVMRPLRALEKEGIEVTVVNCSSQGFLDPHDVQAAIKSNTKLIVLNHASNVVGSILPVAEVGKIARENDLVLLVDAAQTVGAYPIDAEAMNIDLLAFTGHKAMYGPQGTGGLYVREGIDLKPLKWGGTGSRSEEEYQPDFLPDKYESGTMNIVGLAGLGAGVRFVLSEDIDKIRENEKNLTRKLLNGLLNIEDITVYGGLDVDRQVGLVSFNIEGVSPSEVGFQLDEEYEIMCRVGLHCAPAAHKTIGTFPIGTVRLSLSHFTTEEEIGETIRAVVEIALNKG
ncbi:aminotransferase class V-fold PLP-dependent enzyme [Candidatus Poribacteria bacterium]|nr:aminotransferase class V-fold PLP-dependent enzyme [Candidatus Poribacteria bacterium]